MSVGVKDASVKVDATGLTAGLIDMQQRALAHLGEQLLIHHRHHGPPRLMQALLDKRDAHRQLQPVGEDWVRPHRGVSQESLPAFPELFTVRPQRPRLWSGAAPSSLVDVVRNCLECRLSMPIYQNNVRRAKPFELTATANNGFAGATSSRTIAALLWFCSILWVIRVTVFLRQRAGSEFQAVDAAAGIQVLIVLVTMLILLASARLTRILSSVAKSSVLFLLTYYLLCVISSAWSAAPAFSLYRAVEFITMFMGALTALSYSQNFLAAEKRILFISSAVIALSIYANVKPYGFSLSFASLHTNSYSASAAMLFCYCIGEYYSSDKRRREILRKYAIFGFAALAVGTSAASNIATLCGVLLLFLFYRKPGLLATGLFILSLLLVLQFVLDIDFSFLKEILFPGKNDAEIESMSGRMQMWQQLWEYVIASPAVGYGFAVLTSGRAGVFAANPHNSLFSILLGTGILGFSIFLLLVVRLTGEILRTAFRKLPGSIGCAAALVAGLVNSLAMPLVYSEWEESSLVFACILSFFTLFVVIPHWRQANVGRSPVSRRLESPD